MKLVIGGAFQGKLDFAKKMTGKETGWADGAAASKEELSACSGVYDFQELVRRWLLLEEETGTAPEAELEERVRELEKLKVHPRDLSENQQMMERLEALYQEVYPEQKEQVQQMIRTFEGFLDGQNPRQIQGYRRYLEKAVSVLEYYDPFEEEFDASGDDWDLWDEEDAQASEDEETDKEEFWKKEGDDHSWTS